MSKTKSLSIFLIISTIALGAGNAPAQEPAELHSGGRFLGLLHPGQRVRMDDMGQADPGGIQLVLVPDAEWKEIEEGADERMARIQELEEQLGDIEKRREEILSLFRRDQRGERNGLNRNAITELQQAQEKVQEQSQPLYNEISALRRKLPSSISRIEIVGEDYFGVDTGNAIVFYPADRLREITQLKDVPQNSADTNEQSSEPEASEAISTEEADADTNAEPTEGDGSPPDNTDAEDQ